MVPFDPRGEAIYKKDGNDTERPHVELLDKNALAIRERKNRSSTSYSAFNKKSSSKGVVPDFRPYQSSYGFMNVPLNFSTRNNNTWKKSQQHSLSSEMGFRSEIPQSLLFPNHKNKKNWNIQVGGYSKVRNDYKVGTSCGHFSIGWKQNEKNTKYFNSEWDDNYTMKIHLDIVGSEGGKSNASNNSCLLSIEPTLFTHYKTDEKEATKEKDFTLSCRLGSSPTASLFNSSSYLMTSLNAKQILCNGHFKIHYDLMSNFSPNDIFTPSKESNTTVGFQLGLFSMFPNTTKYTLLLNLPLIQSPRSINHNFSYFIPSSIFMNNDLNRKKKSPIYVAIEHDFTKLPKQTKDSNIIWQLLSRGIGKVDLGIDWVSQYGILLDYNFIFQRHHKDQEESSKNKNQRGSNCDPVSTTETKFGFQSSWDLFSYLLYHMGKKCDQNKLQLFDKNNSQIYFSFSFSYSNITFCIPILLPPLQLLFSSSLSNTAKTTNSSIGQMSYILSLATSMLVTSSCSVVVDFCIQYVMKYFSSQCESQKEELEEIDSSLSMSSEDQVLDKDQRETARSEALIQVKLMEKQAKHKHKIELRKNNAEGETTQQGLVILQAYYGFLDEKGEEDTRASANTLIEDVTTQLRFWINTQTSTLTIPSGGHSGKSQMLGFYNIAAFAEKGDRKSVKLYVKYKMGNNTYAKTVGDTESLVLPCPDATCIAKKTENNNK